MLQRFDPPDAGARYSAVVLGSFALRDGDGSDLLPSGRRARALLAYMMCASGPVRREQLGTMLWDDRSEEQVRGSLRQLLYELRAFAAGPAPLLEVDRRQVRLVPGRIDSDLARLRALAGSADARTAAALIDDSEPLADIDGIGTDFDAWLAERRARLAEEKRQIAAAICRRALGEGQAEAAAALADRLFAAEPWIDALARLAMEAHAAKGDDQRVRHILAAHRDAVARELDAAPAADLPDLLGRLAAHAAAVAAASPRPSPRSWMQPHLTRAKAGYGSVRLLGLVALVAVAAVILFAARHRTVDRPRILLVQPFAIGGRADAAAQDLNAGIATDLARLIVGVDSNLAIVASHDGETARASYILAGDARNNVGTLYANVRLLEPASGAILWSRSFSRAAAEADGLHDQVTAHVADVVTCALGGRNPDLRALGIETMRLYLQACEEKHGNWERCVQLLQEVVASKPDFAHAWAMLAAATAANATVLPDRAAAQQFRIAAALARRALALDPHDVEAYSALVDIRRPGLDRWLERNALLRKAIAIDRGNEVVTIDMAEELMAVGRRQEALMFAQRAIDLDPFNQWAVMDMITDEAFYGEPGALPPLWARAASRWPGDRDIAAAAFRYQASIGDAAAAARLIDNPPDRLGVARERVPYWRAEIDARLGRNKDRAVAMFKQSAARDVSDSFMADADALVVLGRSDLALAALERLKPGSLIDTEYFFRDYWAPVRADRRFMAIAQGQGLLAIWQQTGRWPDFCGARNRPYDCARVAEDQALGSRKTIQK